jgi:hypothetical protein
MDEDIRSCSGLHWHTRIGAGALRPQRLACLYPNRSQPLKLFNNYIQFSYIGLDIINN